MVAHRRRFVAASILLVLDAVIFALFVTESVPGALIATGVTCGSWWAHVVLHECGHLVAARLLRLPVVAVHIAPFTGWRNAVSVRPAPQASALRLRVVLFYLSGPMTNLCTAALLATAAAVANTPLTRLALFGAALVAALLGVANLIPATSPRSDGRNLARWLLAPTATRAALRAGHHEEEISRTLRTLGPAEADDDSLEEPLLDGSDPRVALTAFRRRWSAGHAQSQAADLVADAEQLAALARTDGTDPRAAAAIGRVLTVQFGLWYLYAAAVNGSPVGHQEVVEISELAEVAFLVQPDLLSTRVAMSLAHLLNQRPEQARALLVDIRPETEPPDLCSVALLLRAIAECYLGNRAEAEHLISMAGGHYQQLAQVAAAIRAADPLPALFVTGPMVGA